MAVLRKQGMKGKQLRVLEANNISQKNLRDYTTTFCSFLHFILNSITAVNKGRKNFTGLMLHLHR